MLDSMPERLRLLPPVSLFFPLASIIGHVQERGVLYLSVVSLLDECRLILLIEFEGVVLEAEGCEVYFVLCLWKWWLFLSWVVEFVCWIVGRGFLHGYCTFVESQAFFLMTLKNQRRLVDHALLVVFHVLLVVDRVLLVVFVVVDDVLVDFGVFELVFFQWFLHFLYCVLNAACFVQFFNYFLWARLEDWVLFG